MNKQLFNLLKISPAIVGTSLIFANSAVASEESLLLAQSLENNQDSELIEQIKQYSTEGNSDSMSQVTDVDQLRDVSPGDWAYEALRSLVNRYGCIVGYPNLTYRGNRALSRYEFAAGLNACMNVMERLIANSEAVLREDIDKLKRLVSEFEAELATLGARVDDLEGRVAFLEDHQFSTTTKLKGEVIFALTQAFGDEEAISIREQNGGAVRDDLDSQVTFSDRVRLNFDTSFTGKDRLRTRLQARNTANLNDVTGTDESRLGFDGDNGNDIEIDDLYYRFPVGDKATVYVGTNGLDLNNVLDPTNPYFESSGSGAISRFGRRDPLVFRGPEGAGLGVTYDFTDAIALTLAYLADDGDASNPGIKEGLFNGNFSAAAQLKIEPTDKLQISLAYVRAYEKGGDVNVASSTGTDLAQDPFGSTVATSSDRFGIAANYQVSSKFALGGWFSYAKAYAEAGVNQGADADIFNWAVNFAFPDLGKEGNLGGIIVGQTPKVDGNDLAGFSDPDETWHIEALYRYKVNDNIDITPGFFVLINPESNDDNDTIWVGTIRTTFKF